MSVTEEIYDVEDLERCQLAEQQLKQAIDAFGLAKECGIECQERIDAARIGLRQLEQFRHKLLSHLEREAKD